MLNELSNKYADEGNERLGFVLEDNSVVELTNGHDDPEYGAQYLAEDLFNFVYNPDFEHQAIASWHTHPSKPSNLTGDDFIAFTNHPQLVHYIIGNDGVRKFYVDEEGTLKNG